MAAATAAVADRLLRPGEWSTGRSRPTATLARTRFALVAGLLHRLCFVAAVYRPLSRRETVRRARSSSVTEGKFNMRRSSAYSAGRWRTGVPTGMLTTFLRASPPAGCSQRIQHIQPVALCFLVVGSKVRRASKHRFVVGVTIHGRCKCREFSDFLFVDEFQSED